jgi:hypothetical protein
MPAIGIGAGGYPHGGTDGEVGRPSMRVFTLDGSRLKDEESFWREYLAAVRPDGAEYFGRNLAAFRDAVISGGPGWPRGPCRLRIVRHGEAGVGQMFFDSLEALASDAEGFELELA